MGKKRGSYRKKYRIPRQTIYNKTRKRTLFSAVQISNTADDASIDPPLSAIETELENEATIDAGTENEIIGNISAETDPSITSFTSNVWNAVCNKNPFLFPLEITLLSDFISLFPQEISMSLFPREIRMSLFPREIRNAFISLGNKEIFSEASPAK